MSEMVVGKSEVDLLRDELAAMKARIEVLERLTAYFEIPSPEGIFGNVGVRGHIDGRACHSTDQTVDWPMPTMGCGAVFIDTSMRPILTFDCLTGETVWAKPE